MSANIIESFFVALGFEVNTEKIDEFKKKTQELRESALSLGSIFTGAAAGIGLLVQGVAGSMGDIASFAELNDISAKSVAALGKIATENDGSLGGMKSTIQSLNKTIGEAALGIGRGAMTFEKLGLRAKDANGKVKTVDDLLGEVADKMQVLSRQEQIGMAEKLGIDPQFVKVLEKGSENLAKLREEAELMNPFTEQDYELADQVDKLFIKAKTTLGIFTKMLGVSLLPTVKEVIQNYLEWFKASRKATSDVFVRALQLIAGAVGTVWDWVVRLVIGLRDVYSWMTQFKMVTYLAAGALAVFISVKAYDFILQIGAAIRMLTMHIAAFNATALIIPAIIGAIALSIGLLIDDYVNWKEGNDSVIGDLVEQFPALLTIINAIENGVGALVDFWMQQWDSLKGPLTDLVQSVWKLASTLVQLLWPVVKMIFTGWAYIMAGIIPLVVSLLETVIEGWVNLASWIAAGASALVNVISAIVEGIATVFGITFANVGDLWGALTDLFTGNFQGAADHLMAIWDRFMGFWLSGFEKVKAGISWVSDKLGLSDVSIGGNAGNISSAVASSPAMQAASSDSYVPNLSLPTLAQGGVLGHAGDSTANTSITQTTQITGTTIQINSTDPDKAGEAVRNELDRMNKQTTRNGQSAVAL